MGQSTDERVTRLLQRYQQQKADSERSQSGTPQDEARRVLQRVIAALPGLHARIEDAVGAFNDGAADTDLSLRIERDPAPHFAVAVYRVTQSSVFPARITLTIAVDEGGLLTGFLSSPEGVRLRTLNQMPAAQATAADVTDMLLALVEAELDEATA